MIRAGTARQISELIIKEELSLPICAELTSEQIPPEALASREHAGAR
jgi:hypothetical protein